MSDSHQAATTIQDQDEPFFQESEITSSSDSDGDYYFKKAPERGATFSDC